MNEPEYGRLTSRGCRNQFGLFFFWTNQTPFLDWGGHNKQRGEGDKGEEEKKCG